MAGQWPSNQDGVGLCSVFYLVYTQADVIRLFSVAAVPTHCRRAGGHRKYTEEKGSPQRPAIVRNTGSESHAFLPASCGVHTCAAASGRPESPGRPCSSRKAAKGLSCRAPQPSDERGHFRPSSLGLAPSALTPGGLPHTLPQCTGRQQGLSGPQCPHPEEEHFPCMLRAWVAALGRL